MECRLFEDDDYLEIIRWYRERDLPVPPQKSLPGTGYIVSDMAAGFLYLTDSDIALIDCYISNPDCTDKERDLALDLVTKHLIVAAKMAGVRVLKADTQNHRVAERAMKHKFKCMGEYTSFYMEL